MDPSRLNKIPISFGFPSLYDVFDMKNQIDKEKIIDAIVDIERALVHRGTSTLGKYREIFLVEIKLKSNALYDYAVKLSESLSFEELVFVVNAIEHIICPSGLWTASHEDRLLNDKEGADIHHIRTMARVVFYIIQNIRKRIDNLELLERLSKAETLKEHGFRIEFPEKLKDLLELLKHNLLAWESWYNDDYMFSFIDQLVKEELIPDDLL